MSKFIVRLNIENDSPHSEIATAEVEADSILDASRKALAIFEKPACWTIVVDDITASQHA